nr:MAG TPA: hypothetical protein [Bacteriophage sp.]
MITSYIRYYLRTVYLTVLIFMVLYTIHATLCRKL